MVGINHEQWVVYDIVIPTLMCWLYVHQPKKTSSTGAARPHPFPTPGPHRDRRRSRWAPPATDESAEN